VAPRQSDQHTAIGPSTFNFPHNTELYTFCDGQHTCAHNHAGQLPPHTSSCTHNRS
jgi:hypothetical protein